MKTERICDPHCKKCKREIPRKNRSGTRCNLNLKKGMKSLGRSQCIGKHERALLLISLRPTCYRYCINRVFVHILFVYTSYIQSEKQETVLVYKIYGYKTCEDNTMNKKGKMKPYYKFHAFFTQSSKILIRKRLIRDEHCNLYRNYKNNMAKRYS